MNKKVEVTFLGDAESRDHKNKIEMQAKRGDVIELSQGSADHWINRGMAVEGDVKLDDVNAHKSEGLEKAKAALEKADNRFKNAKSVPLTSNAAKNEMNLAKAHQTKKQQEYDALVEKAEKS